MEHIDLKEYNTFGISVQAKEFFVIRKKEELVQFVKANPNASVKLLGGGSNILLTKDIDAVVLKIEIPGISVIGETDNEVVVEAGAGETWHAFVMWLIERNYGGLENLSLIPGCVGAAPMQNIGAYGVEQESCFDHLTAIDMETGEERRFERSECQFGYRESIFKKELKGRYCIVSVAYKLAKKQHILHTDYGAIQEMLKLQLVNHPAIQDVANAVMAIRRSKLPDPAQIGNAGSFFKNPVISKEQFSELCEQYPAMPSYPVSDQEVKVPAGWLIEQCGLKGSRQGDAGVHQLQALVLVNFGNATGTDILQLSTFVQKSVFEKFHIAIEPEVNVW
jgi:UDP-N-acetylmuramate dehydrogenase